MPGHYFMAEGIASESVKAEFLAHANEEQAYTDRYLRADAPSSDTIMAARRSYCGATCRHSGGKRSANDSLLHQPPWRQ